MKLRRLVSSIAIATGLVVACCAGGYGGDDSIGGAINGIVQENQQSLEIHKAQKTEALLNVSGFKAMAIDTPKKQKVIQGLTPLTFNQLAHHGKIRYWFADPYNCKCVYEGDELAYLRYKQAKKDRKKDKQEEAYLIDQENQVDLPMDSEWDPVGAFGLP